MGLENKIYGNKESSMGYTAEDKGGYTPQVDNNLYNNNSSLGKTIGAYGLAATIGLASLGGLSGCSSTGHNYTDPTVTQSETEDAVSNNMRRYTAHTADLIELEKEKKAYAEENDDVDYVAGAHTYDDMESLRSMHRNRDVGATFTKGVVQGTTALATIFAMNYLWDEFTDDGDSGNGRTGNGEESIGSGGPGDGDGGGVVR